MNSAALSAATVCFHLLALAAPCRGAITNGSFESGNFTGWTVNAPGLASVESSLARLGEPGNWSPTDGGFFAQVSSGRGIGVYTIVSQTFSQNAGDTLSLDVFFDAGDYYPFNDSGFVRLLDAGDDSLVATLYARSVADVGDYGSHGWATVSHTFSASGNFRMEAGVANAADNSVASRLGIDHVEITPAQTVPEPATLTIWTLGALGSALIAGRRRRAA
jgi:hypothetical protein